MTGRRGEGGAVAIIAALLATMLLVLAGLVTDLGLVRVTRLQAQDSADAAALAGANALYASGSADMTAATTAVENYVATDFGTSASAWTTCQDSAPLPVWSTTQCISFDSATKPTVVRVVVPIKPVATPLGSLAGVARASVSAIAEASVNPGGRADCGLCVIGEGIHDIQNGDVNISGASAYFNGSLAANAQGSVTVTGTGTTIKVEGSVSNKGTFTPAPATGQPTMADPLSFLSVPPAMAGLKMITGDACTNGPGIYYNTFSLRSCTLQPGLYVLAGSSVEQESGQVNVVANGVTFYFTCANADHTPRACNSPGEAGAGILLTGQASLTINAPTSGPTQGIAILSDRYNTATFGFRGNGAASSGTIYAASGRLDYRGNGSGAALDSLIDVGDLTFSGNNAALNSTYTQAKNLGLPPVAPHLVQ